MLCPYCLREADRFVEKHDAELGTSLSCKDCQAEVPLRYVNEYENYHPLVFSLVGLGGHGKTVYLSSLLYLFEHPDESLTGFGYTNLDVRRMKTVLDKVKDLEKGHLPETTPQVFPTPVIVQLRDVPEMDRAHLLIYDTGGEVFRHADKIKTVGRYVLKSPAFVLLVSLKKLSDPTEAAAFITTYVESALALGVDAKEQMLIVALSQADTLTSDDVPKSVVKYVENARSRMDGRLWPTLEALSRDIEAWLEEGRYRHLVLNARASFAAVRYCALSALGAEPLAAGAPITVVPKGVMAPLYWLWKMQRPRVIREWGDNKRAYFSLEDAVADVNDDDTTLRLGEAIYRLEAPLMLTKPVRLVGAGTDRTRIVFRGDDYVLGFKGKGRLTAESIAFVHEGPAVAYVVKVSGEEVHLTNCSFIGGVWDSVGERGGCGLLLRGAVRGLITKCVMEGNELHGILVIDHAAPQLTGNEARDNGNCGIYYAGEAGGIARSNFCTGNKLHGISLNGQASPELRGNTCKDNGRVGLFFASRAVAKSHKNTCCDNGTHGIYVAGGAEARLEENNCNDNRVDGIHLVVGARATLNSNRCKDNRDHDVYGVERWHKWLYGLLRRQAERWYGWLGSRLRQLRKGRSDTTRRPEP